MKIFQKTICALSVMMIATAPVWAATESTDLTVTGTIAPAACTPAFSEGGVVDYGTIGSNSLEKTSYNLLSQKQLEFSITCDAAAKVAFKPIAGRVGSELIKEDVLHANGWGSTPDGVLLFDGRASYIVSGLGLDGSGNKIGGLALKILQGASELDGSEVTFIRGTTGTSWTREQDVNSLHQRDSLNHMYTWAEKGGAYLPKAFTNSTSTVSIHAYLNKAEALDLANEINIDGLVTFELVYL